MRIFEKYELKDKYWFIIGKRSPNWKWIGILATSTSVRAVIRGWSGASLIATHLHGYDTKQGVVWSVTNDQLLYDTECSVVWSAAPGRRLMITGSPTQLHGCHPPPNMTWPPFSKHMMSDILSYHIPITFLIISNHYANQITMNSDTLWRTRWFEFRYFTIC